MAQAQPDDHSGRKLVSAMAARWHIDAAKVIPILTATAFRQRGSQIVTTQQMAALLIVADQYGLNPFLKEIQAYPDKSGGIVPFVGIDGWSRMINRHEHFNGVEFIGAGDLVTLPDARQCYEGLTCVIYRKDLDKPIAITEWLDECYKPAGYRDDGSKIVGPWQTHTKRMLRHKALIQCARIAFGFVGVYDEDEADRVIDAVQFDTVEESGAAAVMDAIRPKGTPVAGSIIEGTATDIEAAEIIEAANATELREAVAVEVAPVANGVPISSEDAEPPAGISDNG